MPRNRSKVSEAPIQSRATRGKSAASPSPVKGGRKQSSSPAVAKPTRGQSRGRAGKRDTPVEELPVVEPEEKPAPKRGRRGASAHVEEVPAPTGRGGRSRSRAQPEIETKPKESPRKKGAKKVPEPEPESSPVKAKGRSAAQKEAEVKAPAVQRGRRGRSKAPPAEEDTVPEVVESPKGRRGKGSKAEEETSPAESPTPRGRKGKAAKADEPLKAELKVPSPSPSPRGRRGKAETSKSEDTTPVTSPSSRGRKGRTQQSKSEETTPAASPSPRGRKGKAAASKSEETLTAAATPSPRGRRSRGTPTTKEEPAEPATKEVTSPKGRGKRATPVKADAEEETVSPTARRGRSPRTKAKESPNEAPKKESPVKSPAQTGKRRSRGTPKKEEATTDVEMTEADASKEKPAEEITETVTPEPEKTPQSSRRSSRSPRTKSPRSTASSPRSRSSRSTPSKASGIAEDKMVTEVEDGEAVKPPMAETVPSVTEQAETTNEPMVTDEVKDGALSPTGQKRKWSYGEDEDEASPPKKMRQIDLDKPGNQSKAGEPDIPEPSVNEKEEAPPVCEQIPEVTLETPSPEPEEEAMEEENIDFALEADTEEELVAKQEEAPSQEASKEPELGESKEESQEPTEVSSVSESPISSMEEQVVAQVQREEQEEPSEQEMLDEYEIIDMKDVPSSDSTEVLQAVPPAVSPPEQPAEVIEALPEPVLDTEEQIEKAVEDDDFVQNEEAIDGKIVEPSNESSSITDSSSYQPAQACQPQQTTQEEATQEDVVKSINGQIDSNHVSEDPLINRKFIPNPHFTSSVDPLRLFSLASYNILAECHRKRGNYSYTSEEYLDISYRHPRMMAELKYLDADVVCLQEVGTQYFKDTLLPEMNGLGFDGVFKQRDNDEYYDEGEATFWRTSRFTLVDNTPLVMGKVAAKDVDESGLPADVAEAVKKYLDGPIVMLITRLRCNLTGKVLTVGNIHVIWGKMKFPDLQCVQAACAIREVVHKAENSESPHIICGDFNSYPATPCYQLCQDGYLSNQSIEKLQAVTTVDMPDGSKAALVNLLWKSFQHTSPHLKSAYALAQGCEPAISSYTDQMKGCVDYIWCDGNLPLVGVLETAEIPSAMPTRIFPSDHHSVKGQFYL